MADGLEALTYRVGRQLYVLAQLEVMRIKGGIRFRRGADPDGCGSRSVDTLRQHAPGKIDDGLVRLVVR